MPHHEDDSGDDGKKKIGKLRRVEMGKKRKVETGIKEIKDFSEIPPPPLTWGNKGLVSRLPAQNA